MLQTFIWWRHANKIPVSTFGQVVISAWHWCILRYNLVQDIFFIQSKVIDIFPNFKMAAAAILDFQFMWIWEFRRVDSVAFVFCAKFGTNICCSRWDRRTYVSDIYLMTSRELTSGFDFWSSVHLGMAVMHFPMKFAADIFIQSGVIDIFRKLKMVVAAILDLLGWAMGPPTKPHSSRVPPDRLRSFQVIRIWIFIV